MVVISQDFFFTDIKFNFLHMSKISNVRAKVAFH